MSDVQRWLASTNCTKNAYTLTTLWTFDDLLIKTVRLLRDVHEVGEIQQQVQYILVDEYQDTNSLQFALISFLTQKQQNICVVGDEDQSIYKWRGADISNILNFEKHFPNTKTIRLEQNYRSTQTILDVAGAVVKTTSNERERIFGPQTPAVKRYVITRLSMPRLKPLGCQQDHRASREEFDTRAAVCIAPTLNRVCLKKRCAALDCLTTLSVASRSTNEWKSATSSRI
jgi:ATP-dependent exoDNAse (exonuclease V) beta subunit